MFTPNFIQQEYINKINQLFEQGCATKSDNNLSSIIYLLNKMRHVAPVPSTFFEFWFHKFLSEESQTYLSFLNPKYDSTWEIDPKQKANHVENYLDLLITQKRIDEMKEILTNSLEFELIIDTNFIKGIEETPTFTKNNKKAFLLIAEKNLDKLLTQGIKKNTY